MGEVYKAKDTKLERYVALKCLPASFSSSETAKEALVREARAASALTHPNVCRIYDIIEEDDGLFIVMELVDGKHLATPPGHSPYSRSWMSESRSGLVSP